MSVKVKRKRGSRTTTLSRKHQVTLPVAALAEAEAEPGDVFEVQVEARGVFKLIRTRDPRLEALERFTGSDGLTSAAELEELRNEWDR